MASQRPDGTLRPYVIIWVVRANDRLYVRSANGPDNPWYRRAKNSGIGRILAGVLYTQLGGEAPYWLGALILLLGIMTLRLAKPHIRLNHATLEPTAANG